MKRHLHRVQSYPCRDSALLELLQRGDHGRREGRVALELAQEGARNHFGLCVVRHELGQKGADLGLEADRRLSQQHVEQFLEEGDALLDDLGAEGEGSKVYAVRAQPAPPRTRARTLRVARISLGRAL